jgi:putative addiction module component (TIGR02574 family)
VSKTEILAELPKLSPADREEVRLRLAEIDGQEWLDDGTLTDSQKALLEARFRDLETNPQTSIPWEQAKAQLLAALKR